MKWDVLLSAKRFGESNKVSDTETRSRFDQDFDRVVFSHPFRKLQDKTQVFTMPDDDFVHTRLTHSLEVSSVARSLGKRIGKVIVGRYPGLNEAVTYHEFGGITAAAALAHDIGNPPFGHAGEDAISSFFADDGRGLFFKDKVNDKEWNDLINFEGNAQGFRILNSGLHGGLKLTFASLAAFTKYPRSSSSSKENNRKSQKKYGFTQSEITLFSEVADSLSLHPLSPESWTRHPLAFLVEAADDICYHIIDLEDGTRLGLVPFSFTRDLLAKIIGDKYSPKKLDSIPGLNEKLGTLRAMAIGKIMDQTAELFLDVERDILSGNYDKALTEDIELAPVMNEIIDLSIEKMYRSDQVIKRETAGYHVLNELLGSFSTSVYMNRFNSFGMTPRQKTTYLLIPQSYRIALENPQISVFGGLQIVIDFVSSLTDTHAYKLFNAITGNPKF